jgi:hypothetical protein
MDRMDRMKAKGKRQRVKVKAGVPVDAVSFLPFTFLLLPFFYPDNLCPSLLISFFTL